MRWRAVRLLASDGTYRRFFAAATLARVSNEMFPVAVVLLVLEETGSPALAGGAVAALTFPSLVTGPLLGAWLDRRARPLVAIALDQAVSTVAFVGLAFGAGGSAAVIALSVLAGITFPLSAGGFTSLLALVVDGDRLDDAIAIEAADFHLAIVVGPALAGVVAGVAGAFAAVLVQAALKLIALLFALTLRTLTRSTVVTVADSVLRTVAAGVRHVWRSGPLLAVTVAGAVSLGGRGLLTVAFPLFAVTSLGESERFGAYLWTAFAVGSIAGIAATGGRLGRLNGEATTLVAITVHGAVMAIWPLVSSPITALLLVALAGMAYGPALAATISVRQRWTPAGLRGQVFATAIALKPGTFAIGAALAGPLVTSIGVEETLLVAAVAQVAAAGAGGAVLQARRA